MREGDKEEEKDREGQVLADVEVVSVSTDSHSVFQLVQKADSSLTSNRQQKSTVSKKTCCAAAKMGVVFSLSLPLSLFLIPCRNLC